MFYASFAMTADQMTIGDLADKTGVHPKTIRFYEAKGLMPAPRRSASGYRLYSSLDVQRLRLIRAGRSLRLSIADVRELMAVARHENCVSFQGEVARLIVAKLEQVEESIQQLTRLKEELQAAKQRLGQPAGGPDSGPVLECVECRCVVGP